MKINIVMGFFLPMPPDAGGATEKSWFQLALEFARRGHEVTVISRTWRGWPNRETRDKVRHIRLRGHDHSGSLGRNLWLDFWWSLRVRIALPAADVTVANCVALPILLGWFRGRAGRLVVMPGRMPKGQYRHYLRVDRVLATSTPVRDAVIAERPSLAPAVRISGYPINWFELADARKPRPPLTPVTVGYVGRIHSEKGLNLLAAALKVLAQKPGLPTWRVVLCGPRSVAEGGSGENYAQELRANLERALPRGRVEMKAPVFAGKALAEVYRSIDIFCYPSVAVHGETFGVAVAEAMATGAVPVVSALSCFEDLVTSGENGAVFDHEAPDAAERLADELALLIANPARCAQLGAAASASVKRYDFPAFAKGLLDDFATLK